MDNRANHLQLFSRSSTPPVQQSQQHQPYVAPRLSSNSPPNQIDSLFHNLGTPSDHHQNSSQPGNQTTDSYGGSAPVTPVMALTDESVTSSTSAPNATAADRQSALLSLLGGPSPTSSIRAVMGVAPGASLPQQVPTPPGSSQRSGSSPTRNEAQGKILLEQLMAGAPPGSNYSSSQSMSMPTTAPSPPFEPSQPEGEYHSYNKQDQPEMSQRSQGPPPPPPQQQQQPPSPRKSMFDFVSPFDHLSSSSTIKKKSAPTQATSMSGNNDDSGSWVAASDPKRQSVDNLIEHLTRAQPPVSQPSQAPHSSYESFLNTGEFSQVDKGQPQSRVPPPPLPPKPIPNRTASPRSSPPKTQPQRTQARPVDSPASQQNVLPAYQGSTRRDKESSPGPRGSFRAKASITQSKFIKNQSSPSPQAHTIIFDVSQPLDDIQAPRDSVKSTAIALVKQDSVFLPGTTIGATHWVAYAMTRGRVRVISRSSGDRTLLQLPQVFPSTSSVTDMAVYGNRLAGVTSDGGFVVWELPEIITDDVPGLLLLCVPPATDSDGLHSVKWHPKEPDTLAVASETKVYLIDLANTHASHGQPLVQSELYRIGQMFSVSSPVVAFDFDVLHYALATISEDSTLTIWNIHDKLPYTTHKIRGEDLPSSLTFVDNGIVVGRKNGTIFQLLSITTKHVLSTIKFINGNQEDNDMFGHVSYDSRIQSLWVANCRRESMIAIKINLETTVVNGEEAIRGSFDQVVEFVGPKPTIHFVILTADADPNGDEAHAACVAAKIPPGELALVAFSVHSSGVDQILIRREWFDSALMSANSKLPPHVLPSVVQPMLDNKGQRQLSSISSNVPTPQVPLHNLPPRSRTPTSEDIEGDFNRDEGRPELKVKGGKGKNVNWKEKDDGSREKEKNSKISDAAIISDSLLGQALSREIRKTEENLHTRIGRLIGKEMDKQHQRLEDARAHEQAEDFARQEKILKLISTELTRNTTRVVEMAVKSEVQNSVLPSLENITKSEVKAALNDQIGRGLVDFISQSLPVEMEKLLLRPDISGHFAHILSSNLTPLIERHVKEAIAKTFIPIYSQQSSAMHQDLLREIRNEIHSIKAELTAWQSEAFRSQESSIRELEHTVRTLSDQVKYLSVNTAGHHVLQQPRSESGTNVQPIQASLTQSLHRQQNPPQPTQASSNYGHNLNNFQPQPQPPPPPPQAIHGSWYGTGIAAPQASHPATLPQPPPVQPQSERTPPIKPEQWDEIYLGVLHTQDASKLRELLSHTNPELIMPLNGPSLVSQAVILTLIHRLSAVVGDTPPNDESFKTSLWWLQRSVSLLRPEDKLITDFIPRVFPNVQHLLNTTKQRLGILPGGPPTLETARTITEIQEMLRRKVLPV